MSSSCKHGTGITFFPNARDWKQKVYSRGHYHNLKKILMAGK